MDDIDIEQPFTAGMQAEPEIDFTLEEFDHYCELFDRILTESENGDRAPVEETLSGSVMGSAAQHPNIEDYLDEFDRHEIREMRARFGVSDLPSTHEGV